MAKEKAVAVKEKKESKLKKAFVKAFDENGNGQVDINEIIKCLHLPGVRINRTDFLREVLGKEVSEDVVERAILENPMMAKIAQEVIDKLADSVIFEERRRAKENSAYMADIDSTSAQTKLPIAIVNQCSGLLIAMQKLMYLYGFAQLAFDENDSLDSETNKVVIACLGIMFGVGTANSVIHTLTPAIADKLKKKIRNPKESKTLLGKMFSAISSAITTVVSSDEEINKIATKVVAVIGNTLGGAITYLSFNHCCNKLKKQLRNTELSNPNFVMPDKDDLSEEDDLVITVTTEDNEEVIIQNADGEIVQEVAAEEVEENADIVTDNDEE